jgi:cytochrome oxidase Cu insertion factor (SCO1/SenC/PrrC family)
MKNLRVILFCVVLFGCTKEPAIDYGQVPEFSLTDQEGETVTRGDLAGKVWIADFIFTNCAGTCPMITETMSRLQRALPKEVHLVSFSVDPARDTPEVLAEYAKKTSADRERWHFLTGDKNTLYDLSIKGFKLALDETTGTEVEPITHSTRLVLVDQEGKIRGYYGGTDEEDMKRLFTDATDLL